ncbi:rubredoxin [Robertkochia solimangrovi]|uniref:rubredoxin n=1 Tax=Robertkochia solimangrovi TaxID=2213046 RepID=UPI001181761D|nr:rubredoxin [Robertkochia solimangrovi]TRZ42288.1 rubredoxin [Robertkochia solimangrovi]
MSKLTRIIIKGGVIAPAELRSIAEQAGDAGLKAISFGSRQDILFPRKLSKEQLNNFHGIDIIPENESGTENIVSSYVSAGIFNGIPWLTGDTYLYILEQFRYNPKLKINITDPKQRLVPLFTGHLNFLACEQEDYWYLYVKLPGWKQAELYPVLIYSWDISKVSQMAESLLSEEPEDIETLFQLLSDSLETNSRNLKDIPEIPFHPFPYYEGMNRVDEGNYWLGLYWRNNLYDIDFLLEMCDLCAECKIGKIAITPWKSFIIKGIPSRFKLKWEKFLGLRGINVRHSMLELNWHIPVSDKDALKLKKFLVRKFDEKDISTYGLTFAIADHDYQPDYFTSVVIRKNPVQQIEGVTLNATYNLLYAKNFDPNSRSYLTHVQEISREHLPDLLIELSKKYFKELKEFRPGEQPVTHNKEKEPVSIKVMQCSSCLTVYDPKYGDPDNGIPRNTAFADLPETWSCPVCDSSKSDFTETELKSILK